MSSYFDNQYDGEDFKQLSDTDSDSDSDTSSEVDDVVIKNNVDADADVDVDVEDDIEDDDEDDEDDETDDEDDEDDETDDDIGQTGGDGNDDNDVEPKQTKRIKKIPAKTAYQKPELSDSDDDDEEDEELHLQKFDRSINNNYIVDYHPESVLQNYEEILAMIKVVRDKDGIIIDDLHKTIPYLTKYEKARILGQRAKQINSGATPFIKVPENVIDGYIIAELELKEKRMPFIIRRPLPNGGSEYWSVKDLEDILF